MLDRYFNSPARLRRLRGSPPRADLESFAQAIYEARYTRANGCRLIRAAAHFMDWIDRQGVSIDTVNEAMIARFERYLAHCRRPGYSHRQRMASLLGARRLLDHLRRTGRAATPMAPAMPALLESFVRWMSQQRGTRESSLKVYRRPILDFLSSAGENPARFDARCLRQFVLDRGQRGAAAVQTCTTALRAFCRFLHAQGHCSEDLAAAIPKIAHWRLSTLPRYLSSEEVERVVMARAVDSPAGLRERAILLLLARLGLRAGDIAQMRLTDINWKEGWIEVSGKSRRHTQLPLTQELGEALAAYLQHGRPVTEAATVFVRACAPFHPFRSHQVVTHIVDRALRRAGVDRPSRGAAHLLRHSLATSLLRQGTSLQDIADILRHRSVTTTQIYAKVDINALQPMAQSWPGAH